MKLFTKLFCAALLTGSAAGAQPLHGQREFTHQDTLRGTLNPYRTWWDVQRYEIEVTPDFDKRSIAGVVTIDFTRSGTNPGTMQIDLQDPMTIDRITASNAGSKVVNLTYQHHGNAWLVNTEGLSPEAGRLRIEYHGIPRPAVNPPWDGGWIWKKDKQGRPWMTVACQGLGASVWYPCKDHQSDEPEGGARLTMVVPDTLVAVGNGRQVMVKREARPEWAGKRVFDWEVKNPINNYTIIPYIGKYVNFTDTLMGAGGKLDLSYWVLDYDLDKAKKQFEQVKPMLRAFEYWFGPYPFYDDSYKLVQAPHLGMEHQSAVAYGNQFKNGYLGSDLSGSGYGKTWDYIIVHESGHEWFANNITTKDIADMWVHEGFTTYSEELFVEYYQGKEAGNAYVQGLRRNVSNDKPIIGPYGVNQEGSGDMYFKGANMIHTIRQVINDDKLFREILQGLNRDFGKKTTTSAEVEQYIIQKSGKDLSKIFDQYLRTIDIPVLELKIKDDKMECRWTNCVKGFNMPVRLSNGQWIQPSTGETKIKTDGGSFEGVTVDKNFYITVSR
ncbi:M1 family metallopeptidase [Flaviaesturariibacter aridisoli]|uniref:M1 family peptidase n=1 Tax=Flaviaesturariibacter aridisoli TaxID=2545761 RepID=A0A4V2WN54_9BACT|nr:M1 family metallopeptidase [Flaviaesturariibacter aridisoli]TCZ74162.1 M1 family peptidase [Flaviaesturariibacter aridisoli]